MEDGCRRTRRISRCLSACVERQIVCIGSSKTVAGQWKSPRGLESFDCRLKAYFNDRRRVDRFKMEFQVCFEYFTIIHPGSHSLLGRFKASAGPEWLAQDPWWNGEKARELRFTRDGQLLVGHQGFQLTWRWAQPFSLEAIDNPLPEKSCLRIHTFPCNFVRRDPATWGFILESCWTIRTNFPLPPKGEAPHLEDGALPIHVDDQMAEVYCYNYDIDYSRFTLRQQRAFLTRIRAEDLDSDED
eukprot:TRINITY_DN8979_c0_g1_i2.p1 TRINITY_DN8979_c0_g1~~TRINITY_DN8979_c0_g1_i2.p1  ORF type:complete len:243 (+),score=13.51 TRINITY_DN8979_c0_g1_i2:126-854(+)